MSALGRLWLSGESLYGAPIDEDTISTLSRSIGSSDIKKVIYININLFVPHVKKIQ